jgi:hypothetical protein
VISGDCESNQFRNNRGLQDEKNAKLSVPGWSHSIETGVVVEESPFKVQKSWEASAQDNQLRLTRARESAILLDGAFAISSQNSKTGFDSSQRDLLLPKIQTAQNK